MIREASRAAGLARTRAVGGAEVVLELRRVPQPSGSHAELRVCDRGPGVPEAMQERIFEAFFRMPGHAEQVFVQRLVKVAGAAVCVGVERVAFGHGDTASI